MKVKIAKNNIHRIKHRIKHPNKGNVIVIATNKNGYCLSFYDDIRNAYVTNNYLISKILYMQHNEYVKFLSTKFHAKINVDFYSNNFGVYFKSKEMACKAKVWINRHYNELKFSNKFLSMIDTNDERG